MWKLQSFASNKILMLKESNYSKDSSIEINSQLSGTDLVKLPAIIFHTNYIYRFTVQELTNISREFSVAYHEKLLFQTPL